MNSSAIIGALVGGVGGYLLGGKDKLLFTGVGVVGGAVAGVGLSAAAAAALPAASTTPGNGSIVLSSGDPTLSVGLQMGLPFTIQLPPGAAWTSGNNTPSPAGGTAPITWNYAGPGTLVLDWTDATSQPQETTLTLFTS